jgi:cytosine deaminase
VGTGFATLPAAGDYRIVNARAPACLVAAPGLGADAEGFARIDVAIGGGRIDSIVPSGTPTLDSDRPALKLDGGILLPRLVDIHTHLDKGQIWARRPNPDGTFMGALTSVSADREARWSAEDVARRMDFSLRCALSHGTGAVRTHLDSIGPQSAITWPIFAQARERWAGRIALQGVALFALSRVLQEPAEFDRLTGLVAEHGGVLGGVTFEGRAPDRDTDAALDRLVQAAKARGLDLDLHVDESNELEARTLERVADAVLRNGYEGKVLCGHCCALSLLPPAELDRLIAKVVEARLAVVSLPMCNMYLQDRLAHRTPRWRGVAPLHELRAAGVPVMVASDNTRDPFYAYGDLDMLEVFREATRILHLDHSGPDWIRSVASTPADLMGLDRCGRLEAGDAADLILLRARSWTELMARPQADRTVLVNGAPIDAAPPDYRELDDLMKA